jgi:xanthine dehydrogenase accessory factor
MAPMDLEQKALNLKKDRIPFARATVVKTSGSAPRHVGAKMLITARGEIFGTIGGGTLEHQVIADAKETIRRRTAELKSYPLGPMLGQCCGGDVDVFIEPQLPKKEIVVFGAGHIAEELCPMLPKLGFHVTLVDERKERIELPAFAGLDKRLNELPGDALRAMKFDDGLHIVVITHEHRHDEAIVEYCFGKPFKYLGCIGSKTKWAKFRERYKSRGIPEEQIARVTTPIGLDIGSETPFEIAVSIVAQLITLANDETA